MSDEITEFSKQFLIPGMTQVSEVRVDTAMPTERILENIEANKSVNIPDISENIWWRSSTPIAIVGGGPSLKETLHELKDFKYIMACGSVHDFLIDHGIVPGWCVLCDPDGAVVNSYLKNVNEYTIYLAASQSDPSTFNHLRHFDVYKWNLLSDHFDSKVYGEGQTVLGGGSTVATRAMVIAMGMGFWNFHLFGVDTCLRGDEHHAYEFNNEEEKSSIGEIHELQFEKDGPKFKVAGYHLGQLFDIKAILSAYADKLFITVHGESLLSYFMELAHRRYAMKKEFENGTRNRSNGAGN
jgi:hypothetical protein